MINSPLVNPRQDKPPGASESKVEPMDAEKENRSQSV
jgi:hypothetical protein